MDGPRSPARALARSLCVLTLLAAFPLFAQQYNYEEYGLQSGMKNAAVNSITQDRQGFLWVGTMSGLFRGDGRDFREFGESDGLPSGTIQSLLEDKSGRLWVATRYGVALRQGDRFAPVDFHRRVEIYGRRSLALLPDGSLLAATSQGLFQIKSSSAGPAASLFRQGRGPADAVFVDNSGAIWLSERRTLIRLLAGAETYFSELQGVPASRWDSLLETPDGTLWIRSSDHLVRRLPGAASFSHDDAGLPDSGFFGSLYLDHDGHLLVPTDSGLSLLDGSSWRTFGVSNGLPSDSVSSVFQDREGSLWVGLWGFGLVRILGYGQVESWSTVSGLSNAVVGAILRDNAGRLWAGTDSGLNRLSQDRTHWETWRRPSLDRFRSSPASPSSAPGLGGNKVRALVSTRDGALWAGSFPGGVTRVAPNSAAQLHFSLDSGQPFDRVNGLLVDHEDRLWIASIEGLFRSQPHPGATPRFERLSVPGAAPNEAYFRMTEGPHALWIATSHGLLRYDGSWRRFSTADGLLSPGITHVAQTPDGLVWVAYRDPLGISSLSDAPNPAVHHYQNRLSSRSILQLRTDRQGRLWVGGDDGLDVLAAGRWSRFTRSAGLAGNSCSVDAFYPDPDGSVWIGTARGLTRVLNPKLSLSPPSSALQTVFTSVSFGEHALEPAHADGLKIPYADRALAVSIAALTFRDRDSVRFRYRLLGLHESWVESRESSARYPKLEPGTYTFEAYSFLPGSPSSVAPVRLSFRVLPPFWSTWWFRSLLLLALAAFIGLAYAWRMRSLDAKRRELELAVAERTAELEFQKARAAEEKDNANKANRFKSEFLARMSHEIRTPLHGVIGMTDLLLRGQLHTDQREMVQVVQDSAGVLMNLINDVLDLSKIEAGRIVLDSAAFELRSVAAAVCELMRPAAETKGLHLVMEFTPSRIPLLGDANKVKQILLNLVSNAVKFTSSGSITIRAEYHRAAGPLAGSVHLSVTDTGIGIPEAEISSLFQPFQQLEAAQQLKTGGTGLGLAICKSLAEAMGGSIAVESQPGRGTSFLVELPLPLLNEVSPEPAEQQPDSAGPAAQRRLRVLVAEDNAVNQRIILRMLATLGHEAAIAPNGVEAVRLANSEPYDAILMDCQMPEMDGLDATRTIRTSTAHPEIPIIGLSANVFESDQRACREAGMNAFLGKPLRLDDLARTLNQWSPNLSDEQPTNPAP